ncbi:signal peptidase II [Povalibacter uvarum]|uniref:Lipoprotein signal peptidase n=1 Tax=Povalibacter uvarum TaxID=732238 RepID=A0A841HL10_9GAMM|nr:signal peptidase II [Povalibacter uvarum]MBB6092908.1 signal peptidase II [Povalibacter uvarum]
MLKRLLLIMTILISCVGCDQATKSIARTHLSETRAVSLMGGSVRLQLAKNYGAFLSIGASMHEDTRSAILSAGVATMLVVMFVYCLISTPGNPLVVPALAMVIGGGVSNLIDRLLHGGYVVDFLNLGVGSIRTGIFNVADVFIMSGVLLLVAGDWLTKGMLKKHV